MTFGRWGFAATTRRANEPGYPAYFVVSAPRKTWCLGSNFASHPESGGAACNGTVAPAEGNPRITNTNMLTSRPSAPSTAISECLQLGREVGRYHRDAVNLCGIQLVLGIVVR
jgi:hypothetical protein